MNKLSKIVSRQDVDFKLTPSSSNETSINLSTEISNFISDESGEIAFRLYKQDLILALSSVCVLLPLYYKKETTPANLLNIYPRLLSQIQSEFGENESVIYTIGHLKREDGRNYLNGLKLSNGFTLRSFLIEKHTQLDFCRDDNNQLSIRVITSLVELDAPIEIENVEKISIPSSLLEEPLQIIYYGAPGTGKSHKIDNDPHVTDENTIRTTFHPDSDYSTFVGAYKPTMASMPVNAFVGTTVHHAKNADNEKAYEKKIVYKYVPQAFLKAYVAAWSDLDNPHFLVIEEINRGNCAQIFGDLFQLLDRNNMGSSSYAIHADEDITQFLAEDKNGFANLSEEQTDAIRSFVLVKDSGKTEAIGDAILSGKKLLLPPNLYIWATMNTSDQSLFPIDSAFKRRWNWEYMPIDYDAMDWQFEASGKRYLWSDFLKKMNPLIYTLTQSSDKQMGYFFAKADKKTDDALTENNLISEKIFLNKVLFYLWTDVLKDFEAGDKIFRDEEKEQMYQFSDFFPTTNGKLAEFVGKLELPVIGDSVFDNSSVDDEDDTSGNNTKSSKDQSRYSVNGVGTLKKGPAAVEAMRLYVQNNPDATAADIVSAWKIPGFPLVESEESFASRLAKSNDDRLEKRTELINLANGESIRIFKGFNPQSMQDFINALDKQDWNIIIRKV